MAIYNLFDENMSFSGISITDEGVIFSTRYGNIARIQENGYILSFSDGIVGIIEKDGSIYAFEEGRLTRVPFGTLQKNGYIVDVKYCFLGTLGQDFADKFFNNETGSNSDTDQDTNISNRDPYGDPYADPFDDDE